MPFLRAHRIALRSGLTAAYELVEPVAAPNDQRAFVAAAVTVEKGKTEVAGSGMPVGIVAGQVFIVAPQRVKRAGGPCKVEEVVMLEEADETHEACKARNVEPVVPISDKFDERSASEEMTFVEAIFTVPEAVFTSKSAVPDVLISGPIALEPTVTHMVASVADSAAPISLLAYRILATVPPLILKTVIRRSVCIEISRVATFVAASIPSCGRFAGSV